MNSMYDSQELGFYYNPGDTANEGRPVSNFLSITHSFEQTILLTTGTTAGLQVWVNNSRPLFRSMDPEAVMQAVWNDGGDNDYISQKKFEVTNPSFSSQWVNITNDPCVTVGASAFYVNNSFRFIRLQGSPLSSTGALTANTSGTTLGTAPAQHGGPISFNTQTIGKPFATMWTANSVPGR